MKEWWKLIKPLFKTAKYGKTKIWYTRTGPSFPNTKMRYRWREHHIFSLCRVVNKVGSYYKLNLMRWSVAFYFKPNKGRV